jgi:phosphonate transport system substrate-binding protein
MFLKAESIKVKDLWGAWTIMVLAILLPMKANADIQLKFGVYTSDKPSEMVKSFRPILNAIETSLANRLGEPVKIRMQVANSYEKGIDELVTGAVDFARFGPASYITARENNPDIRILAIESKKGRKEFNGVICVANDSLLQDMEDLKGKRFAFGNEHSTIGRYLSQLYMQEHGIRADDLMAYEYLGRHDTVGAAVAAGQFDAGALKESTYKKMADKGLSLRAIATFKNVTKPWIARSEMPDRVYENLQVVLLEMDDPDALGALKKDGFLAGTDADYAIIRTAIQQNQKFFE